MLDISQLNLSGSSSQLHFALGETEAQGGKLEEANSTSWWLSLASLVPLPRRGLGVEWPRERAPTPHPTWNAHRKPGTTSTQHSPRQEAALCHPPAWTRQASGTAAELVEEEHRKSLTHPCPLESRHPLASSMKFQCQAHGDPWMPVRWKHQP